MGFLDKIKGEVVLKWALVGGALLAGGVYVLPVLLKIAWDAVSLLILGIIGLALFFLLPAICEFLASLGWRLWELVICRDPLARLRRDETASARQIDEYEKEIGKANASIAEVKDVIRSQMSQLSKEEFADYGEKIKDLEATRKDLIAQRDEMFYAHQEFCRNIQRADAKNKIGKAFMSALGAFRFKKRAGAESAGAKIAFGAVDKKLAESHERLKVVLSRPKPELTAGHGKIYVPPTIVESKPRELVEKSERR